MLAAPRTTALAVLLTVAALAACSGRTPQTAPQSSIASAPAASTRPAMPASTAAPDTAVGVMRASTPAVPMPAMRADRSVLSRDDIRATQYTNLYDVVAMLRGNWLRVRTAESFTKSSAVQVYLDMQRLNGVDELRTMSPLNVLSVRFFDPIQASARWGMDHGAGAIFILTAKK